MGEPKKKEISSLAELKEMAKAFGKKLVKDVENEGKKPFSQTKAAGKVMEQIDAATDAPKRAFVGKAQKTGSVKEGAKAAVKQLLEGGLLEDTPEFSDIVEKD